MTTQTSLMPIPQVTFGQAVQATGACEPHTVQLVSRHGWCLVGGVPCDAANESLSKLGRVFGRISMQGTARGQPNLENDGINRIQALAEPLRDAVGNAVLSTNADEFSLHTDDSYNPEPARYVLMHCWQADASGGGVSWISDMEEIVRNLPASVFERLLHTSYPTPYGSAYVLEQRGDGHIFARFNRRDMSGYARLRGGELSPQQACDLAALEEVAMRLKQEVLLQKGDCIVADNHRVLHGRSAFDGGSGRLVKRLRLFAHA